MSPTPFIACVEDDLHVSEAIKGLLEAYGFTVEAFASAEDFLDSADLDRATCAILDMRLPGMNGLDLQQRLIARPTPMPIVFVSAHEEAAMRAMALRSGAIAFLKKPFDNSTLLDALNRSIR